MLFTFSLCRFSIAARYYSPVFFCRSHFQTGTTSIVWPSASIWVW